MLGIENDFAIQKENNFSEYVCEYEKRNKNKKEKFLIHRARVGDCVWLDITKIRRYI